MTSVNLDTVVDRIRLAAGGLSDVTNKQVQDIAGSLQKLSGNDDLALIHATEPLTTGTTSFEKVHFEGPMANDLPKGTPYAKGVAVDFLPGTKDMVLSFIIEIDASTKIVKMTGSEFLLHPALFKPDVVKAASECLEILAATLERRLAETQR